MTVRGRIGDRVIVALDTPTTAAALALVDRIGPACTFYKVGLELYTAVGPAVVASLRDLGKDIFLDLKLHDIPNQVARATERAGELGVRFLTVHASGGRAMLESAAAAAPPSLELLAVTVLTSFDARALSMVFGRPVGDVSAHADRLAALARESGVAGVVCAASEAARVRIVMGLQARIVTPGIRLEGDPHHDQRRVRTAAQAFRAGATHIVVGRPVTSRTDPRGAFERIVAQAGTGF